MLTCGVIRSYNFIQENQHLELEIWVVLSVSSKILENVFLSVSRSLYMYVCIYIYIYIYRYIYI